MLLILDLRNLHVLQVLQVCDVFLQLLDFVQKTTVFVVEGCCSVGGKGVVLAFPDFDL